MKVQSILCYGDSNTWGRDPDTRGRFNTEVRWPCLVLKALGDAFLVIEEGLVGRTTVWDDPEWLHRNGKTYFPIVLETHAPLDVVIIALGANDLKSKFNLTPQKIAEGVRELIEIAKVWPQAPHNVLIICPPPCTNSINKFYKEFEGAIEKSQELSFYYEQEAKEAGCDIINAGQFLEPSNIDGLHLDARGHKILAEKISDYINDLMVK
jgi:lysophospholipase L1-like esterase